MAKLEMEERCDPRAPDREPRGRQHGREERLADVIIHILGLAGACGGAAALFLSPAARHWPRAAPLATYALALVATFAASAAYNLAYDTRFRPILRRIDHSAIFLMIAGTYTPFTSQLAPGNVGLAWTAAVWIVALGGVILKLTRPRFFERVSVFVYLTIGWSALMLFPRIAGAIGGLPLSLLVAGGALYTLGVCFHLRERLHFHNAIWHAFVLAAAACQYSSVFAAFAFH